jgi:hypothetical protein
MIAPILRLELAVGDRQSDGRALARPAENTAV